MCSLMEHSERSYREKLAERETADQGKSAENLSEYPQKVRES